MVTDKEIPREFELGGAYHGKVDRVIRYLNERKKGKTQSPVRSDVVTALRHSGIPPSEERVVYISNEYDARISNQ